jgi:hypothetical protein
LYIEVIKELCWGMQRFCLSTPPGNHYAWNATTLFSISMLGQTPIEPGQFDTHAFVADNLEYWIAKFPSDDRCSIISITRNLSDDDSTKQLANLAQNREARKECLVHKVVAARALRDGYAPAGPQNPGFPRAYQLRYTEYTLQWRPNSTISTVDRFQSSGDVIAATFQLIACAKSLLACLPDEACEFHEF